MIVLTRQAYEAKAKQIPYYARTLERRWGYMSKVLEEVGKCQFETCLEIGAYMINMTTVSDNMDFFEKWIDNTDNKMYLQDATSTPWEIEDKYYDLTICLQVFEHFEGKQAQVFAEIKRTSLQAIISIPWKWQCPEDVNHHNINESHLKQWFGDAKPYRTHEVNNRLILCFRF